MNELLIKDFIIPLVLLIVGSSFTGAVAVGWWGVQRIVKGQDDMHETLKEISGQISAVKERTGQLETRESMRDKVHEKQHEENKQEFRNIWKVMGAKKGGAQHG